MAIPERARQEVTKRLNQRWDERWPDLKDLSVRFRGSFAYVEGGLPEGLTMSLFRLRYIGSPKVWGFAIHLARGYEDSVLPSGSFTGTPEEALDCACGFYLRDPSAWQFRSQRSRSPD